MNRIQLLEALCDCAASDPVIVTDGDGRLIYWNHAAERGLGLNETSLHAASDHLFRKRDGKFDGAAERAQALAAGRVTGYYVLTRPGHPATAYEAVTAPLFLGRGTLIGFATVFHERPEVGAAGLVHAHHRPDQVTGLPGRREFDDNFALDILRSLRARGIAIALDDFGTGYSSLGHMTSLPIDFIKMDISFVRNVPDDLRACAIVSAIIDLAHRIDLKVIAEGVERAEQAAFLRGAGCDELQGYFFGRPALASVFFRYPWRVTRP